MGTKIRPELSAKNKYWINRHRYYELKHFCLQYHDWKKAYLAIDGLSKRPAELEMVAKTNACGDPTAKCAMAKEYYSDKMKMVEQAAIGADPDLASYILRAVTEELSYTYLKTNLGMPCSKDTYYDRYRKFFWLLNEARK